MKKVLTKDDSYTFLNEEVGEHYHSKAGAVKEAIEKFARPSGIAELSENADELTVLDICFGLGYNTAAVIDMIREQNPACRVTVYAFEQDRDILEKTAEVEPPFLCYELIRLAARKLTAEDGGRRIRIFPGDVRDAIKLIPREVADVVLFDPFSPQKTPHLWTEELFRNIYDRMKPGARLVTYSCAGSARRAMKAAGFKVADGPSVGRRSPSTIAQKCL